MPISSLRRSGCLWREREHSPSGLPSLGTKTRRNTCNTSSSDTEKKCGSGWGLERLTSSLQGKGVGAGGEGLMCYDYNLVKLYDFFLSNMAG